MWNRENPNKKVKVGVKTSYRFYAADTKGVGGCNLRKRPVSLLS
jgi:hypothetical protein